MADLLQAYQEEEEEESEPNKRDEEAPGEPSTRAPNAESTGSSATKAPVQSPCAPPSVLARVHLPQKPAEPPHPAHKERLRALVSKADNGHSVSEQLRNDPRIRNPYFTSKLAAHFGLAEHSSHVPPHTVNSDDTHTALGAPAWARSACFSSF